MSIYCKAIRQIYYNAGSGYTVASYMTNEDLPEEVKKQKNGNYGIFQAFGFFRNYPLLLLYPMYLNFASSNCLPHLPYIVRFIIFNLLLVPSTNPLL